MPSVAPATIVVYDPRADRARTLTDALTACALTHRWIADAAALTELRRAADECGVALVAVDGISSVAASSVLKAIALLKHKGYTVLGYADGAADWALGHQCRLLLAGATHLMDSGGATFGDELRERVARLIDAERERRSEERRVREQMRGLGMVGSSAGIDSVFRWILRVSPLSDLPVLISGETGTGKELVARSIHRLDPRRSGGPFIAVNCGAISAGLAESELFGHRRGAFTGADHDRTGLVRAAGGGVLFLDEIGDLDPALQSKLLRVLQEHRVLTLGDDHEVAVNVRVIAATNRNLEDMGRAQTFRADLFHRLDVLSIRMPALRQRLEDIEPLVRHFVTQYSSEGSSDPIAVSKEFVQALCRVDLPGNVRQLENVVRRALVTRKRGEPLRLSDLPPELWLQIANVTKAAEPQAESVAASSARASESADWIPAGDQSSRPFDVMLVLAASSWKLAGALDLCEQHILSAALDASSGNRSRAARLLGISARSIFNKMRKHRLTP
jgi:DNA-binding NtrC family response regulator